MLYYGYVPMIVCGFICRKGKGKGKGKGNGKAHDDDDDAPTEKTLPTFTKLKDVKPGTRSYDLVVQVPRCGLYSCLTMDAILPLSD